MCRGVNCAAYRDNPTFSPSLSQHLPSLFSSKKCLKVLEQTKYDKYRCGRYSPVLIAVQMRATGKMHEAKECKYWHRDVFITCTISRQSNWRSVQVMTIMSFFGFSLLPNLLQFHEQFYRLIAEWLEQCRQNRKVSLLWLITFLRSTPLSGMST